MMTPHEKQAELARKRLRKSEMYTADQVKVLLDLAALPPSEPDLSELDQPLEDSFFDDESICGPAIMIEGKTYFSSKCTTHAEVLQHACLDGAMISKRQDGFLTSRLRFVARNEAFKIAKRNKQVNDSCTGTLLYSHDVKEWRD